MKNILESVETAFRPNDGFACATCPFAAWRSGGFGDDDAFLDCYCHKLHSFTYDSTNRTSSNLTVAYKHIKRCLDKEMAVNEVLKGN